jgi:WhiB family redox-sensing transcriptional regulator
MTPLERLDIDMPSWTASAACADADPRDFHPETGNPGAERRAKMVCAECPVQLKCLDWQMSYEDGRSKYAREGIYGGLNPFERANLANGTKRGAA